MHTITTYFSQYCPKVVTDSCTKVKNACKTTLFKLFAYPLAEIAGVYAGKSLAEKALQVIPSTPLVLASQAAFTLTICKTTTAAKRTLLIGVVIGAPLLYYHLSEESQEALNPLAKWLFSLPFQGICGYLARRALGNKDPHTKPFICAQVTGKMVETLLIPPDASPFIVLPLQGLQTVLEIQAYTEEKITPFTDPQSAPPTPWIQILLKRCLGKEEFKKLEPIFQEEAEKQLPELLKKLNLPETHPLALILAQTFSLSQKASHIHKSVIFGLIFSAIAELQGIGGAETLSRHLLTQINPHSFPLLMGTEGLFLASALKTKRVTSKLFFIPWLLTLSYIATAKDPHQAAETLLKLATTTSFGILGGYATLRFLGNPLKLYSPRPTETAATYGVGMARLALVGEIFKLYTPPSHPVIGAAINTALSTSAFICKTVAYNTHQMPSLASNVALLIRNVKAGSTKKALLSSALNFLLTRYYGQMAPVIYEKIKEQISTQKQSWTSLIADVVARSTTDQLKGLVENENYLVPFVLRSLANYTHACNSPKIAALYKEEFFNITKLEELLQTQVGYKKSLVAKFSFLGQMDVNPVAKQLLGVLEDVEISLTGFCSLSPSKKALLEKTLPLYLKYYLFFIFQNAFEYKKALTPAEEEVIVSLLLETVLKASPNPLLWIIKGASEKLLRFNNTVMKNAVTKWVALAEVEETEQLPASENLDIDHDRFKPQTPSTSSSSTTNFDPELDIDLDQFKPNSIENNNNTTSSQTITFAQEDYYQ